MRIIAVRRICQLFFLFLFLWFCWVSVLGDAWWQLRGWPVNWFLDLDPLIGLGTLLATGTLYAGLLWGLLTIVLTVFLGRFFCGWICPLGTLQQAVGFMGRRKASRERQLEVNRYSPLQNIKYWLLVALLTAAGVELIMYLWHLPLAYDWWGFALAVLLIAATGGGLIYDRRIALKRVWGWSLIFGVVWITGALVIGANRLLTPALQTGLLDPICLVYRSVNLVVLPLADATVFPNHILQRYYSGALLVGALFSTVLMLSLLRPRFYCRYLCPLGALLGVVSRFSIWRIGQKAQDCRSCHLCARSCEGACEPDSAIRTSECVLCLNCREDCPRNLIGYRSIPSAAGEISSPQLSRRAFLGSAVSGMALVALFRAQSALGQYRDPTLVRPPGALGEPEFLSRCIKCGQCMRICPTNVIQPAGLKYGLEPLWSPVLDFRIGTSGCQFNCIACGNVCPTAAIRPITLEERLGAQNFQAAGPLRIGTAFVDRGRCLPWAMDTPCIVCQENCPVSPKAIFTRERFQPVRHSGPFRIRSVQERSVSLDARPDTTRNVASGDYYVRVFGLSRPSAALPIAAHQGDRVTLSNTVAEAAMPAVGEQIEILIRLQQPYVDPARCIGCGVCQHECPVRTRRAIRVTAENESRSRTQALLAP